MKRGLAILFALILPLSPCLASPVIVAQVLSLEGQCFAEKTPLKVGMKMGPGVTVSTKSCAKVKLFLYPRGVAYLGPDSSLKLGKPEQPHKALAGLFRFIYSKSEEFKKDLLSKGTYLATVTDSATVGIRGTDYMVVYNPILGETEVVSFDGTLAFTNAADASDSKEVPSEYWGGVGGRFGAKTHDLIHLPPTVLDQFKKNLTWESQAEGLKSADDLGGEGIPEK